jgi:hypothetical protein
MYPSEPCIRTAAVLTSHWNAGNVEAVVLLLAGISSLEEAVDIITGMLITRKLDMEVITAIISQPLPGEAC